MNTKNALKPNRLLIAENEQITDERTRKLLWEDLIFTQHASYYIACYFVWKLVEKCNTNHLTGICLVRKIIYFLFILKSYIQIGIFSLLCNYNFKFLAASNLKTFLQVFFCFLRMGLNIFILCTEQEFYCSRHKDVLDMASLHAGDINKMDVILISKLAGYFLKFFSQTNQTKIQVKLRRKFQNPVSEIHRQQLRDA